MTKKTINQMAGLTVGQMSDELVVNKQPSLSKRWKELCRYFLKHVVSTEVWQRRPVTIVIATFCDPDGQHHTNIGTSKVCHPDEWKPGEGEKIAFKKAAANAAKDIVFGKVSAKLTNDNHRGVKSVVYTRHYVWNKPTK